MRFSLVLVTYNRSNLLKLALKSIFEQNHDHLDSIYIIDNCSTDDTQSIINNFQQEHPAIIHNVLLAKNLGGAGGFEIGCRLSYEKGSEWIGLLDDDVMLDGNCLEQLSIFTRREKCLIAIREDTNGNLAEYGALRANYSNPFRLNPKISTIVSKYKTRNSLPPCLEIDSASFEGFFIHRSVIEKIGFPNHEFFIFGDDTDYSLRIKKNGIKILAIRDAKIIRLLPFIKTPTLNWKQFYRWRNFFILHFLHGTNTLVRLKPFLIAFIGKIIFYNFNQKYDMVQIVKEAKEVAKSIRSKDQFDQHKILKNIKKHTVI